MAEYDKIAKVYDDVEDKRICRKYGYDYTLLKVLGDLGGKKVLDLACGSGYFTRQIKLAGAEEVVGIDISEGMIKVAEESEKESPLGIRYLVGDVIDLGKIKEFDVVCGSFLLHYSKTKEDLSKMCKNAYKNLRNGEKFVTINNNPEHPLTEGVKYGSTVRADLPLKEGDELTVTLFVDGGESISFLNYHWKKETYEEALRNAGFKDIKWHSLEVSKEGVEKYGAEFWEDYIKDPYLSVIVAVK